MTASKSNGAYDTLIFLRDKLTRLNGVITPEAVDKLEDKLGGIFMVAKTHHYVQGQKYGHLASAIPESKYRLIIGDGTWTHGVPADLGAYSLLDYIRMSRYLVAYCARSENLKFPLLGF